MSEANYKLEVDKNICAINNSDQTNFLNGKNVRVSGQ